MVVALGPGKFYGSGLPRPRFYSGDRVDPPVSVLDPLLSWAHEAHWSMGGLSFKRRRLQGRIEGSIEKLRKQKDSEERSIRKKKIKAEAASDRMKRLAKMEEEEEEEMVESEEEDDEEEQVVLESDEEEESDADVAVPAVGVRTSPRLKKRARSLRGEFDEVASLDSRSGGELKKAAVTVDVSPARRRKKRGNAVVTSRRSGRISPKKSL